MKQNSRKKEGNIIEASIATNKQSEIIKLAESIGDPVLRAIVACPESSSEIINYLEIKNKVDPEDRKSRKLRDHLDDIEIQKSNIKIREMECKLQEKYDQISLKNNVIRFGYFMSPMLTTLGSVLILIGSSTIVGLGLIGFGVSIAGSIFAIASGNKVSVNEFKKTSELKDMYKSLQSNVKVNKNG